MAHLFILKLVYAVLVNGAQATLFRTVRLLDRRPLPSDLPSLTEFPWVSRNGARSPGLTEMSQNLTEFKEFDWSHIFLQKTCFWCECETILVWIREMVITGTWNLRLAATEQRLRRDDVYTVYFVVRKMAPLVELAPFSGATMWWWGLINTQEISHAQLGSSASIDRGAYIFFIIFAHGDFL